jgi:hypothetical protein
MPRAPLPDPSPDARVAHAPDLYHGKSADNVAEAEVLGRVFDADRLRAEADIADAAAYGLFEPHRRAAFNPAAAALAWERTLAFLRRDPV